MNREPEFRERNLAARRSRNYAERCRLWLRTLLDHPYGLVLSEAERAEILELTERLQAVVRTMV
jgi:hypothetical protein